MQGGLAAARRPAREPAWQAPARQEARKQSSGKARAPSQASLLPPLQGISARCASV